MSHTFFFLFDQKLFIESRLTLTERFRFDLWVLEQSGRLLNIKLDIFNASFFIGAFVAIEEILMVRILNTHNQNFLNSEECHNISNQFFYFLFNDNCR